MSPTQYRNALERLGMTQESAAEFLGVSLRTSHGYANGSPIPVAFEKLLFLMTLFHSVQLAPKDPIFGLTEAYVATRKYYEYTNEFTTSSNRSGSL